MAESVNVAAMIEGMSVAAQFTDAALKDFQAAIESTLRRVAACSDHLRNDKLGQVACRHTHMTLGIVHGDPCPVCRAQA